MIEFDSFNFMWEKRPDGANELVIMVKGIKDYSDEKKRYLEDQLKLSVYETIQTKG